MNRGDRFNILFERKDIIDRLFPILNGWLRWNYGDLARLFPNPIQTYLTNRGQNPVNIDVAFQSCGNV